MQRYLKIIQSQTQGFAGEPILDTQLPSIPSTPLNIISSIIKEIAPTTIKVIGAKRFKKYGQWPYCPAKVIKNLRYQ